MFRSLLGFALCSLVVHSSFANDTGSVKKTEAIDHVALRMIGHQILLSTGDSSSRVLPVKTEGVTHTISFENEFSFHPDTVSLLIDSVVDATGLASDYIVQFLTCDSNLIAHSYKVSTAPEESVLACKGRSQPKACYYLKITVLDKPTTRSDNMAVATIDTQKPNGLNSDHALIVSLILIFSILVFFLFSLLKRKQGLNAEKGLVQVGKYQFNPTTMELAFGNEKAELTSKEADLLHLLSVSVNTTVARAEILNKVWGDDGDYVGRTLDVFISKLRKKLEGDPTVKIVNIRGIGYRLVIEV